LATASQISHRIIDAALSRQLEPNTRLGEQDIAQLFGCSRTIVREAMVDLAARGIVAVSPRRGWFLTKVDVAKARELYEAREVIESGFLRRLARQGRVLGPEPIEQLREHLAQQQEAVEGDDVNRRSYLLGNFHVRLAECLGNSILAERLRDLTVLTTLFTMRHQTPEDARMSYEEHVAIVDALAAGDFYAAEERMYRHLGTWESKVHMAEEEDPLGGLRQALAVPC